jgi:hypothetical protein
VFQYCLFCARLIIQARVKCQIMVNPLRGRPLEKWRGGGVLFQLVRIFKKFFFTCVDNFFKYNPSHEFFFSNFLGARIFFFLFPMCDFYFCPPPPHNGPPLSCITPLYFIILPCLTPDDIICQGESAGAQWVKAVRHKWWQLIVESYFKATYPWRKTCILKAHTQSVEVQSELPLSVSAVFE